MFMGAMAAFLALWGAPARAAEDRVAAVVNDGMLTASQVDHACTLQQKLSGVEIPADKRGAYCRRVLVQMIDAELLRQYAETHNIGFDPRELDKLRPNVLDKLGMTEAEAKKAGLGGAINDMLADGLRQELVLKRVVEPQIYISTAEVDKVIHDMAQRREVVEREISQIMMKPTEDEAVAKTRMEEVAKRLAAGESFEALAREASEGSQAANGGKMGWFSAGELNPMLEDTLDKMKPGEVSGLIRTPLGWHLIRLDDVRKTVPIQTTPVRQVHLILVAPAAGKDMKAATKAMLKLNGAKNALDAARADGNLDVKDLGWMNVGDLEPALANALPHGERTGWTSVFDLNGAHAVADVEGYQSVMPPDLQKYRDKVYQHQFANAYELESRKFMRDLRAKAFVDIRY